LSALLQELSHVPRAIAEQPTKICFLGFEDPKLNQKKIGPVKKGKKSTLNKPEPLEKKSFFSNLNQVFLRLFFSRAS